MKIHRIVLTIIQQISLPLFDHFTNEPRLHRIDGRVAPPAHALGRSTSRVLRFLAAPIPTLQGSLTETYIRELCVSC